MDEKGPKGSWRHHNVCMCLCTYVKRCKTPKVPGRLEALSHWQWSSVIILLSEDKLKTKLPQIHVQIFLGISEITFEFCTSCKSFYILEKNTTIILIILNNNCNNNNNINQHLSVLCLYYYSLFKLFYFRFETWWQLVQHMVVLKGNARIQQFHFTNSLTKIQKVWTNGFKP